MISFGLRNVDQVVDFGALSQQQVRESRKFWNTPFASAIGNAQPVLMRLMSDLTQQSSSDCPSKVILTQKFTFRITLFGLEVASIAMRAILCSMDGSYADCSRRWCAA